MESSENKDTKTPAPSNTTTESVTDPPTPVPSSSSNIAPPAGTITPTSTGATPETKAPESSETGGQSPQSLDDARNEMDKVVEELGAIEQVSDNLLKRLHTTVSAGFSFVASAPLPTPRELQLQENLDRTEKELVHLGGVLNQRIKQMPLQSRLASQKVSLDTAMAALQKGPDCSKEAQPYTMPQLYKVGILASMLADTCDEASKIPTFGSSNSSVMQSEETGSGGARPRTLPSFRGGILPPASTTSVTAPPPTNSRVESLASFSLNSNKRKREVPSFASAPPASGTHTPANQRQKITQRLQSWLKET